MDAYKLLYLSLFFPIYLKAQPQVHEEAHHQPVFENSHVRILNVSCEPGDSTLFHSHCNPIAYITIQGAELWLEGQKDHKRQVQLPTGWLGTDFYVQDSCFVHRFGVEGTDALHIIAIEKLKDWKNCSKKSDSVFEENGFRIEEIILSELQMAGPIPFILKEDTVQFTSGLTKHPGDLILPEEFENIKSAEGREVTVYSVCFY